jgi:hypothetical protein
MHRGSVLTGGEPVTGLDTVLDTLTARVQAALAATDAGPPARICAVPGQLAWDDCRCGVLAVTVEHLYPSAAFPQQATGTALAGPCPPAYEAAAVTVTVLRCAPGQYGNPPTCEALTAAAITWFTDLDAVRATLACALLDLRDADTIVDFTLGDTVPAGPEGGCVGLDTHLTVGFVNCLCPAG